MDLERLLKLVLEMALKQVVRGRPEVYVVRVGPDKTQVRDTFVVKNLGNVPAFNVVFERFRLGALGKSSSKTRAATVYPLHFECHSIEILEPGNEAALDYDVYWVDGKGRRTTQRLEERICLKCLHRSRLKQGKLVPAIVEPRINVRLSYGDAKGRRYVTEIRDGNGRIEHLRTARELLKERLVIA